MTEVEPELSHCQESTVSGRRVNVHLYTVALRNDSRFHKQAKSILKADLADEVILVGRSSLVEPMEEAAGPGVRLVRFRTRLTRLPRFKPFGVLKYTEFSWREARLAKRMAPCFLQCHSVSSLPAAVMAKSMTRAPLIYDARELETEARGLRGINRVFTRKLERALIRNCDSVLCVSDSIADWYARAYGIPRPFVVRNIPDRWDQVAVPASDPLRCQLGLPRSAVLFIYSGALQRDRRIEQLIRVFQRARSECHLVFMGFGPLTEEVKAASGACPRVHFLPAVLPDEVLNRVAAADVGIVGVENKCLSYHLSLPNKLFEYLLAGIPFLAPDYPEMRRVLDAHHCGWAVGETDEDWLAAINAINREKLAAKRELVISAREAFSWEQEERNLIRAYRDALERAELAKRC